MADGTPTPRLTVIDRLADVAAADWDRCAGDGNPFVSHAFLEAMESSGSCTAETGWLPQHLVARDGDGRVIGAVPMYLKSHSYGEYVFDHGWADAYRRAGGRYYPKLQVAVPFSPVPGPRLLVAPDAPSGTAALLVAGLIEVAEQRGVSSLHITFAAAEDVSATTAAGLLLRQGYQFHWMNRGYADFEGFLGDLASRKRKSIRKERRDAVASGVVMHRLSGSAIEERHWDAFFRFYMSTSDRKWGQAYLNRNFFSEIGRKLADRIVLVMAEHDGRLVAGALNLRGADALYGRNWGCLGDYPFLHFEACYYQAIDYAIEHRLARVEAGAQGEHKLQRGYLPTPTWSAHWIRDPGFRTAVADYLQRERAYVQQEMEALAVQGPFRKDGES